MYICSQNANGLKFFDHGYFVSTPSANLVSWPKCARNATRVMAASAMSSTARFFCFLIAAAIVEDDVANNGGVLFRVF
jgi:hypothetical protein